MHQNQDKNTPNPTENLAEYVKRLRKSLEITQQELADKAGLHLQSIGKIERGKTNKLNAKAKRGLAYALSIPLEYLDAVIRGSAITATKTLKICPKCWSAGAEPESIWTEQRSRYCFICGTKLRDRCPSCQTPITSYTHRFCPFCGTNYKQLASVEEWKLKLSEISPSKTE
ncbi:MAG TPA: zinc ribbon domain-containing protein [Xenococcaceae cyanobacterium]